MGHDRRCLRRSGPRTLARLRSGHREAGEPAPAPSPKGTRSVLVREVLTRDEVGRILKTKEYEITEPLLDPEVPGTQ